MHFTQIELYNFGLYQGSHIIDLSKMKTDQNVTLIGGLNGRGKTTIIEAVFLAFYGKRAVKVIQDRRSSSYPIMLDSRVNKLCKDRKAYIKISCILDEKEMKKLVIKRSWKRQGKNTKDEFEVQLDGREDLVLAQNWNYYVEEILPLSIARFFFFDSERISEIAEDESFEEIKSSIESIMGISTVNDLENDMKRLLRDKSGQLEATGSENLKKEQEKVENNIEKIKTNIDDLKKKADKLTCEIAVLTRQIEIQEENFWKEGGFLGRDKAKFEESKEALSVEKNNIIRKMQEVVSDSMTPLVLCKDLIKDTLHVCEENEKAIAHKYSLTFLKELRQSLLEKIQDSFDDEKLKQKLNSLIINEFEQYLKGNEQDNIFLVSEEAVYQLRKLVETDFFNRTDICDKLVKAYLDIDKKILQVNAHLDNEINELDLKEIYQEIKDLEEEKAYKTAELKILNEEEISLSNQMRDLEKTKTSLFEKIAESEMKVTDASKIIRYATISLRVMDEFKKRLQKSKTDSLQKNIMHCFRILAGKQNMISEIRIDSQTLDISLIDSQNAEIQKAQLSAGEKQIFAVAVLWGLAVSSGYKMPVIIDTPMARLDSIHRKNFVQKYLPNASDQVLVLSTDEEIYGEYLDDIRPYVSAAYTLIYDENEESTSIYEGYFGEKICF